MKKIFLSFVVALLICACAPSTKQDYMAEFSEFIETVSEKSLGYNDADWKTIDADYEKLSGEWYDKFEPEMSLEEKMQVSAWIAVYNYHKGLDKTGEIIDEIGKDVNDGINELGEEIEKIGKTMQE